MARIKDLIAAIITATDGFEDTVRVIAAAGHSATLIRDGQANSDLGWLSQDESAALKALLKQGVYYKKVNLKSGVAHNCAISQSKITQNVRSLLYQLQRRDELHYPFTMIDNQAILFISTMDLDIMMALAREQQQMQESDSATKPRGRLFKDADSRLPKE